MWTCYASYMRKVNDVCHDDDLTNVEFHAIYEVAHIGSILFQRRMGLFARVCEQAPVPLRALLIMEW